MKQAQAVIEKGETQGQCIMMLTVSHLEHNKADNGCNKTQRPLLTFVCCLACEEWSLSDWDSCPHNT